MFWPFENALVARHLSGPLARGCVFLFALMTVKASASPLADVVDAVKPSIVGIASYEATRSPPVQLRGTGFVVDDGYYVATNAHVVPRDLDSEGREYLVVLVGQGKDVEVLRAEVAVLEPKHDLAVLRLNTRLQPLALDSAAAVREGEIYAFTGYPIGNVLGLYPATHRGMISSITPMAIPSHSAKALSVSKILRLRDPVVVYQLDGTAYPGNSGSPLYRMNNGAVVGILNQVYVKSTKEDMLAKPSGISYAIPVKHLQQLIQDLESKPGS